MPWRQRPGPSWWSGKFRGQGYRLTLPRQAIMDLLSSSRKHLSAEEIYLSVHKVYPGIGLATVYRTLELLEQMGFLNRFDFGHGRARYEMAEGPNASHHHHLICNECGKVVDYDDFAEEELKLVKQTEEILSKRHKFEIHSHRIHFYGTCSSCRNLKKA